MKKIYFLVLALCFFGVGTAQIINFPDANFKAKLLSASSNNQVAQNLSGNYFRIDTNNNSQIEVSEALAVGYLDVGNSLISDLTGITAFSNLTYLNCSHNTITTLDVNSLTNLTYLNCSSNLLTSLLVNNLINLTYLNCFSNRLASLSVNSLINLTYLNCSDNGLPSLTVSSLINLTSLICNNNYLS